MEKYAIRLNVGDKVNMHSDGWKIIKTIKNRAGMTDVIFEDGSTASFWNDERLFVV